MAQTRQMLVAAPFAVALPHPLPPLAGGAMLDLSKVANQVSESELQTRYPYLMGAVFSRRLAHHAGRICAKKAISSLVPNGCFEGEMEIGRGSAGEPIWPEGIVGSITHTPDFACAVAALSSNCGAIGVDSEMCVDAGTCEDIASVCLTPLERARFLRGSSTTRRWSVTVIFCIKEAFYKAAYPQVQRFIEFEELEITQLDLELGHAIARNTGNLPLTDQSERITARFVIADRHVHASVTLGHSVFVEPREYSKFSHHSLISRPLRDTLIKC